MEHSIPAESEQEDVQPQSQQLRPAIHNIEIPTEGLNMSSPSQSREGYGFRPRSGLATPQILQEEATRDNSSPIPDQYGLGWPGSSILYTFGLQNILTQFVRASGSGDSFVVARCP